MFHEDTNARNHRVLGFVFGAQFLAPGFFLRLIGRDMVRFKALKARIFKEHAARRKGIAFLITNAFVVDASSKRVTERAYKTLFHIDDKVVFHRMGFFYHSIAPAGPWHLLDAVSAVLYH